MEILNDIDVDWNWRDRNLIMNLYNKQSAFVSIGESLSQSSMIGRGVWQGCTLLPLLYNLYDEAMMREALYEVECGKKVGGHLIKTVRFADDKAVVASSEKDYKSWWHKPASHQSTKEEEEKKNNISSVDLGLDLYSDVLVWQSLTSRVHWQTFVWIRQWFSRNCWLAHNKRAMTDEQNEQKTAKTAWTYLIAKNCVVNSPIICQ